VCLITESDSSGVSVSRPLRPGHDVPSVPPSQRACLQLINTTWLGVLKVQKTENPLCSNHVGVIS